jgi:diaminobutyrate-2-oxoglutarate transaminase
MLTRPPIEELESNVRYYSREYPVVFSRAENALLFDSRGRRYIDFFCGANALNYGHNHPHLKNALLEYLQGNGIIHSLDLQTEARSEFLRRFREKILAPRQLEYKVQFTGPTGTNAVEAALKLARKITRRSAVVAFTNAFHGVSLGSLAATAQADNRRAAGVQLDQIIRLPFDGFLGSGRDIEYVRKMLTTRGSGLDSPAAFLFETVQGEGGLNAASESFIVQLFEIARQVGALVIIDEIQTGCGRVGPFFSFEHFSVAPDLVCLSKSISGLGLPMALLLMRPEHDQWKPGEHNGTFRGLNLAFVTAAAALDFWDDPAFLGLARSNGEQLQDRLDRLCLRFPSAVRKGRGLFTGLEIHDAEVALRVKRDAFEHGLLIETCGPNSSVLKTTPPINIAPEILAEGLDVLEGALERALSTPVWAAGGKGSDKCLTPS